MRITSSALQLAQQHSASSSTKVQERLSVWQDRDAARPATARIGAGAGTSAGATVQVRAELSQTTARSGVLLQLSDAARQARAQDVPGLALGRPAVLAGQVPAAHGAKADAVDRTSATAATTDEEDAVEPRLLMLARMVEAMTGFKVRVTVADTGRGSGASAHGEVPPQAAGGAAAQGQSEAPQRGVVQHNINPLDRNDAGGTSGAFGYHSKHKMHLGRPVDRHGKHQVGGRLVGWLFFPRPWG